MFFYFICPISQLSSENSELCQLRQGAGNQILFANLSPDQKCVG